MSETVTGAELARLFLHRGATAAEVAAMDLEPLTRLVAYRRQKKIPSRAVSPNMTDEQIARAILEYAQSEPGDWPAAPRETTPRRGCRSGLLGALGGGVGGFVFVLVGAMVLGSAGYFGENAVYYAFLAPLGALPGAILGGVVAAIVTRSLRERGFRARVPLATGLAVSFVLATGYWLWQLADAGELNDLINHLMPRSAHSLREEYQAGRRNFYDWNLRGAHLSGADLSGANLRWANLSGADLSHAALSGANLSAADLRDADLRGADLFNADLRGADLSEADLRRAKVFDSQLAQAASLKGAIMPDGTVHE